jgi:hypothetical protein
MDGTNILVEASVEVGPFSMPGKERAIFLNKPFTLCPALADVSMNRMLSSLALLVASSWVTSLRW